MATYCHRTKPRTKANYLCLAWLAYCVSVLVLVRAVILEVKERSQGWKADKQRDDAMAERQATPKANLHERSNAYMHKGRRTPTPLPFYPPVLSVMLEKRKTTGMVLMYAHRQQHRWTLRECQNHET